MMREREKSKIDAGLLGAIKVNVLETRTQCIHRHSHTHT